MKIPGDTEYIYPLLINGERYFLNKDPFLYAEEGVAKYWPEKIESLSLELTWKEFEDGKPEPSSTKELMIKATKMLAPHFLANEDFIKYFKQDGGKIIAEATEIQMNENDAEIHRFPKSLEKYEEEREVS